MRIFKSTAYLTAFILSTVISTNAQANTVTIPFSNLAMEAGTHITADYKFNPTHQTLVCQQDNAGGLYLISWTYAGTSRSAYLPVTLKADKKFEGELAEASGRISLDYRFGSYGKVSCFYKNMD